MLKKELVLKGLDCANCAAKIEDEVNKINGVKAYMNFMNKTLNLEIESEKEYKNTLQQVETIVHKHEPDVSVEEKSVNKGAKKALILEGLDCANCASKIETQTKSLEGVIDASVDFVSKKLTIEVADKREFNRIFGKVAAIVKKIEPDVKVVFEDNTSKENEDDENEENRKKEIIKLVLGGAIFSVGLIFNFQNWLELTIS